MLQVSSITAITIVGLLISLMIVFCGMGILWAWRRIKLQNNSMLLLAQAQSMAQERAQTLQTWLQKKMGLDPVKIEQIMAKHTQQEATFFQSMQVNMIEQNMATGEQLNQSFDQLQNLLKEITTGHLPNTDTNSLDANPATRLTDAEIATLQENNQKMASELTVVKETMDAILGEYSRMFALQDDVSEMVASKEMINSLLDATVSRLQINTPGETDKTPSPNPETVATPDQQTKPETVLITPAEEQPPPATPADPTSETKPVTNPTNAAAEPEPALQPEETPKTN